MTCQKLIYGAHNPIEDSLSGLTLVVWLGPGRSRVSFANFLAVGSHMDRLTSRILSKSALSLSSSFHLILFKYNHLMTIVSNFWTTCGLKRITKRPTGNWSGHIGKSTTTACHFPSFSPSEFLFLVVYVEEMSQRKFSLKYVSPSLLNRFIRWIFIVV